MHKRLPNDEEEFLRGGSFFLLYFKKCWLVLIYIVYLDIINRKIKDMRTLRVKLNFEPSTVVENIYSREFNLHVSDSPEEIKDVYKGKVMDNGEGHKSTVRSVEVTLSLAEVLEKYNVKFTKPQQEIVGKLMDGWRLGIVNSHRMNGGEYMWVRPGYEGREGDGLEYAGKVYKAFHNISYAVYKQIGVSVSMMGMSVKVS